MSCFIDAFYNLTMDFLAQTDNLVLAALIIISGTALFMPTLSTLISGKGLTPTDATIWINRRKASVIDLRAEEDFKLGHLPNAKNIALESLGSSLMLAGISMRCTFTRCGNLR